MPSVDQLQAAPAVADDDEMPISQAGLLHRVTRAQVVAGLQPSLSLAQGQLLGRSSAGAGAPEPIGVGANLAVSGGTLSAAAPFSIPALSGGTVPAASDLVALAQSGHDVAIPYAEFMAGLPQVAGIDAGGLVATPQGATASRRLRDIAADAMPIEAFGAVGDGVTDDSAALAAAIGSGQPVRLGPRTYVVNGQFTISAPGTTLLGTLGASVLKRGSQTGNGAWIAVQADRFRADGVTFDANRAAVSLDSWGVLVSAACTRATFTGCRFLNAAGSGLGSGLVFAASDPALCEHLVQDCEFAGNTVHGLWVQACAGVQVRGCLAHDNGAYGINVDFNDAGFVRKVRLVQLLGNRCWNNQRGIAIGNFNATNATPPTWSNANPDAMLVVASGNICHDNTIYGIAAAGAGLLLQNNLLTDNGNVGNSGAGILANVAASRVAGNLVSGAALYGIDCGGSVDSEFCGNRITGAGYGINCGGGSNLRVAGNTLQDCSLWGVCVNNVETDGNGRNFGLASSNTAITGNWISFAGTSGGVVLRDGPQMVLVADNHFAGTGSVDNCLWGNTDSLITERNRFNLAPRFICNPVPLDGTHVLRYPDIADAVMVTNAPSGVQSMLSSYQVLSQGQVSFIRVTSGGTGYTTAAVAITGAGTGAEATAMISNGALIGVVVTASGSGYGPIGTVVAIAISGDGTGATASGHAGAPLAEERRLLVRCNSAVQFTRAGSLPLQENWTGADIIVPANGDVEWRAAFGMWRAGLFAH